MIMHICGDICIHTYREFPKVIDDKNQWLNPKVSFSIIVLKFVIIGEKNKIWLVACILMLFPQGKLFP